ncbi:hypothetical protein GCM10009624_16540 [Gordonia sinesedis]
MLTTLPMVATQTLGDPSDSANGCPMVTTDSDPGAAHRPLAGNTVAYSCEGTQPVVTRCSPVPPEQYDAAATTTLPETHPVGAAAASPAPPIIRVAAPPAAIAAAARTAAGRDPRRDRDSDPFRVLRRIVYLR